MMSTWHVHPYASATPVTTLLRLECTSSLVSSLTVRIVPSIRATSGMMLLVVPLSMWAIVTTAGSNTSTSRVIIVWMAPTMAAAAAIGSRAVCGAEA